MTYKHLIVPLVSIYTVLLPTMVLAGSIASSSATPAIDKDLIREKLKERLEQTVKGVTDPKTATSAAQPTNTLKAYFGLVSEPTNKSLKLTRQNQEFTVNIPSDATLSVTLKGKSRRSIKVTEIEEGWFAIAIGTFGSDGKTLEAERISFSNTQTESPKREIILGKITEVDEKTLIVENGTTKTITIPKKFSLTIQGVQRASLDNVTIQDKVIAVVTVTKAASPSPSATPRSRPRTSPKATPSPTPDTNNGLTYELRQLYVIPGTPNSVATEESLRDATPAASSTPSAAKKK